MRRARNLHGRRGRSTALPNPRVQAAIPGCSVFSRVAADYPSAAQAPGIPVARAARQGRGGTLVEFALVAPVVLLLFATTLELALLFWVSLTMQHAVREGARLAVTGAGGGMREALVMQRINEQSMGLYGLVHPVLHVNGVQAPADGAIPPAGAFGTGGSMLLLRLDCSWPVATPLLRPLLGEAFQFSVAASMRNEAFE